MATAQTCGCGHPFAVHSHYRAGNDCGICGRDGCSHFSKPRSRLGEPLIGTLVVLLAAGRSAVTRVSPGGESSPRPH